MSWIWLCIETPKSVLRDAAAIMREDPISTTYSALPRSNNRLWSTLDIR